MAHGCATGTTSKECRKNIKTRHELMVLRISVDSEIGGIARSVVVNSLEHFSYLHGLKLTYKPTQSTSLGKTKNSQLVRKFMILTSPHDYTPTPLTSINKALQLTAHAMQAQYTIPCSILLVMIFPNCLKYTLL